MPKKKKQSAGERARQKQKAKLKHSVTIARRAGGKSGQVDLSSPRNPKVRVGDRFVAALPGPVQRSVQNLKKKKKK